VDATCASIERKINELTDKMVETMKKRIAKYSQYFNQSSKNCIEPDSILGSPESAVSLHDDFDPSNQSRAHSNGNMPLHNLEQQSDLHTSLSPDIASLTSSPKDVTEDVLAYADLPAPFTHSREFEAGEDFEIPGALDMGTVTEVNPYDLDDSEDISQGLCDEVTKPTILDFDDDILSIEYEFFDVGLMSMYVWMWISVMNMNHFLVILSKLTTFLDTASPKLSSLIMLSLRILI